MARASLRRYTILYCITHTHLARWHSGTRHNNDAAYVYAMGFLPHLPGYINGALVARYYQLPQSRYRTA